MGRAAGAIGGGSEEMTSTGGVGGRAGIGETGSASVGAIAGA